MSRLIPEAAVIALIDLKVNHCQEQIDLQEQGRGDGSKHPIAELKAKISALNTVKMHLKYIRTDEVQEG